jgi:hypothetical protein
MDLKMKNKKQIKKRIEKIYAENNDAEKSLPLIDSIRIQELLWVIN